MVQEAKQPSERRGCPSCASPWWTAAGATVTWLKLWDPNYELWADVKEWESMHWEAKKSTWPHVASFWQMQDMAIVGSYLDMPPQGTHAQPQGTCCRVASIQLTMARPSLLSCPWPWSLGLLANDIQRPTAIQKRKAWIWPLRQSELDEQPTKFDNWRICDFFDNQNNSKIF